MMKNELIRIGRRPVFWFVIGVGLLLALIPVISGWPEDYTKDDYAFYPRSAYISWMFFIGETYPIYALVFPLLASIAYSDSYAEDINTGVIKNILTRVEKRQYLLTRFIVNFLIGGILSVFPLVINFMGQMAAYPLIDNNYYYGMPLVSQLSFWPELFYSHPMLYTLLRLLIIFLFGATLASIGLAFSTIVKNRYIILIFPFLLVLGMDVLLNAFGILSMTQVFLENYQAEWLIIIYLSVGILGSFIMYSIIGKKNETI